MSLIALGSPSRRHSCADEASYRAGRRTIRQIAKGTAALLLFAALLTAGPARATDLMVKIEASTNQVSVGETLVYYLDVINTSTAGGGPFDSPNTVLTAALPEGVRVDSIRADAGQCTVEGSALTCDFGTLPAGAYYVVRVYVEAVNAGTFTATANLDGDEFDPVPANNTASTDTIIYGSKLSIVKSAAPWVLVNDTLQFTLLVTNEGPDTAVNVRIEDQFSAVFDVLNITSTTGTCTTQADGQTARCEVPALSPLQTVQIDIRTLAGVTHPGRENTGWATADNAPAVSHTISVAVLDLMSDADNDGVSNGDEIVAFSDPLTADYTDLVIEKSIPVAVKKGEIMNYGITVTNQGNPDGEDAIGGTVRVEDTLPDGLTLKSASPSYIYDPETRLITFDLGYIPKGDIRSIVIDAVVDADAGTEITNTALVQGIGLFDTNTLNNISSGVTSVVSARTDLSIIKTGTDAAQAGDVVTFEIVVSNTGFDPATNVTATDVLNPALAFKSAGSSAECTANGQTVTCTVGTLAAGESKTFTIAATVSLSAGQGDEISNAATVAGAEDEFDPAGNNTSPAVTFIVLRPCRAYVLIGAFNGSPGSGYTGRIAVNTADEAQSDYEKAGYVVIRKDSATYNDFRAAVADPFAKAIWFFGHGAYKTTYPVFFDKLLGTPEVGLQFRDRWVDDHNIPGGPFTQVEQITFHACGQDLPEWREMFPTAVELGEFDASENPTRPHAIYYWQLAASYPPCDPSPNKAGVAADFESPPRLHRRLWPEGQYHLSDTAMVYDLGPVTNSGGSFVLDPSLRQIFEGAAFNVLGADTSDPVLLFGAEIEEGTLPVANQSSSYIPNAAFDVIFSYGALDSLFEDPETWPLVLTTSGVGISNLAAGIDADSALAVVATLLWGYPYETIDLAVDVTASETVSANDTLAVVAEIVNDGEETVRSVELAFELPEGLELDATDPDCSPSFTQYVCELGELEPGGEVHVSLSLIVTASPGAELSTPLVARAVGYEESTTSNNQVVLHTSIVAGTALDRTDGLPETFALHRNYPNPFNPSTTIPFDIVASGRVVLEVFDVLGRKVTTLVDQHLTPGRYDVQFVADEFPSGVYVYRIHSGRFVESGSMLLLK